MAKINNTSIFNDLGSIAFAWFASWWEIVVFGMTVALLALTPSSYIGINRRSIAYQIVHSTKRNLTWFTIFSALISLVLIRIVVVTAFSYGLSRFAIEMVVRVLIVELIPLTASIFVALRYTLPESLRVAQIHAQSDSDNLQQQDITLIRRDLFPRAMAGVFSVWLLGAVSCIMTLVLTYLTIYGFTLWAMTGYTRIVGQIFDPSVTLILGMKIFFFSLAVSLIPMASVNAVRLTRLQHRPKVVTGMAGMVRLFAVVLMIEVISLMANYY